jgi:FKBP-type peptidyl-prolyl cis-trans isomerase 2
MKSGNMYAFLKNKEVVPCSMEEFSRADLSINKRRVAFTKINNIEISTVFLGINHGFGGKDLWFETMIFGGFHDDDGELYQERYETWQEAEEGHLRAVKLVMEKNK